MRLLPPAAATVMKWRLRPRRRSREETVRAAGSWGLLGEYLFYFVKVDLRKKSIWGINVFKPELVILLVIYVNINIDI